MTSQLVSRSAPSVKAALKASFPGYKGRKVRVERYSGPRSFDLYWSGGTRDQLVLLSIHGRADLVVEGAPWSNRAAFEPIDQPAGTILAVHTTFQGVDCGVTFIVRQPEAVGGNIAVALLNEGAL